jgi:hypothetical protein
MVNLELIYFLKKKAIEFDLIFVGDLNEDLILMNELENIRHIQPNKVNNNSLGKKYFLIKREFSC